MNPILRWAGSKRQLIRKLGSFWPVNSRYIEPFCGSACLFFALEPDNAILGDVNHELIEVYEHLRDDPERVIQGLKKMKRSRARYYRLRAQDPSKLSRHKRVIRFLYLNKHCFNGIYRTNRLGQFNVPYGPQKHDAPISERTIMAAADLLQRALLIGADFSATLNHAQRGDFVYLDPPFLVTRRRVFREYTATSFGGSDLERLKQWLCELDNRGVNFLASYADCREARELFRQWGFQRVRTRRNVAGFIGDRRNAYELLATNMNAATHGLQVVQA